MKTITLQTNTGVLDLEWNVSESGLILNINTGTIREIYIPEDKLLELLGKIDYNLKTTQEIRFVTEQIILIFGVATMAFSPDVNAPSFIYWVNYDGMIKFRTFINYCIGILENLNALSIYNKENTSLGQAEIKPYNNVPEEVEELPLPDEIEQHQEFVQNDLLMISEPSISDMNIVIQPQSL